jgi:16S rRNA pseudouridine516 synthase
VRSRAQALAQYGLMAKLTPSGAAAPLQDILFEQGFGTRRICAGLIQQGHVHIGGAPARDPLALYEPQLLALQVQGSDWVCHNPAYLMVNKPSGYEVSQKPKHHPSVYSLLDTPLRQRPSKGTTGVQAVGRLDEDTTGLLLMSDDGQFIHRMSSPKHHVPKVYEVTTVHPVSDEQVARLCAGVVLDDDPKPVAAAAAEKAGETHVRLTLTEGKYHQVKRMLAAVGNRVASLHRSQMGEITLGDLPSGQWRWLTAAEVEGLTRKR